MFDDIFPFDRVVVMDRYPLTGLALCSLADDMARRRCSEHVVSLAALRASLQRREGKRLLLITELMGDSESLRDGIALLKMLQPLLQVGLCRVVVCTDVTDPLLLKAVVNEHPSVLVLRREPLAVLRQAIGMAEVDWPDTVLSPAVTDGLMLVRDVKLAPRELEMLVTRVDYPGVRASAKVMKVSHKTVSTWQRNITQKLGESRRTAFTWRMAQIRKSTGRL